MDLAAHQPLSSKPPWPQELPLTRVSSGLCNQRSSCPLPTRCSFGGQLCPQILQKVLPSHPPSVCLKVNLLGQEGRELLMVLLPTVH